MECVTFLLLLASIQGSVSQQYFRVKPHDTSVIEGRTAELHCHVGNRVGQVQWSKDGFLLGYDPDIPGYERYEMRVDHTNSAYTLLVHNARLEDEGEFQCQVGPGKKEKPIRSVARLTVLVPPRSLSINGLDNNSAIDTREAEKVVLECQAVSSKPATILKWYRKSIELMPEASKTSVRREGEKRYTTVSSITLYPKGEAFGVPYSCEAFHPALQSPMRTTVSVQVLYPPSPPEIEGYRDGDVVQAGDRLTLACISRGGKPPARLVWYRNGDVLTGSYSTMGREATNTLEIAVTRDDNNVIYGCAAINPLTERPLFTTVKLNVLFPPQHVAMNGPAFAERGETVTVTCRSDVSNPPAEITWAIDDVMVDAAETEVVPDEKGWYTSSKVTAKISRQETEVKAFTCSAVGVPRHDPVFQTFNVTVYYPPEKPEISGYFGGEELKAGKMHEFVCTAVAGNPPAEIVWTRAGTEVPSYTTLSKGILRSVVNVEMLPTDNEAYIRCEVNNTAVPRPLFTERKLRVLFPPNNVSISMDPPHPKEGDKVRLECWASSSNPASRIIWWQNGRLLTGHQVRTFPSTHGGLSTTSTLNVKPVSSVDDGSKFTCEAKNEAFEESAEEQIVLRVRYAPEFSTYEDTLELVEGQSGEFNISAKAYPDVHQYVWKKDGTIVPPLADRYGQQPRVSSDGSLLIFKKVSRQDSGEYTCTARNTEGSSSATLSLNVLYPAIVMNITNPLEVPEGESASFECRADGNPLPDNIISWRSTRTQRTLSSTVLAAGKSILTIKNVSRSMDDILECVADNGVGSASVKQTRLIVMYRPYVLREELKRLVAVGDRTTAELECGADGHPTVAFTWSYNGTTIGSNSVEKQNYHVVEEKRQDSHWWSKLVIKAVDVSNFGVYTCVAKNELGHDFITFTLAKTGIPDKPSALEACNVTHQSVCLKWRAGFDGGLPQTFMLRFRDVKEANFTIMELPGNRTVFHLGSLQEGTVYEFAIAAKNSLGKSGFAEGLKLRTRNVPVMDSTMSQLDHRESSEAIPSWLLGLAVVGGVVVVINALICVGYFRRKSICGHAPGGSRPELNTDEEDGSDEKKIPKKKKIPCGVEEDTPPFYLSGTTVDLPDEALDLSSFQKVPSLRQISREANGEDHVCDSRRCDCVGRHWGNVPVCREAALGHDDNSHYEHQECPDILKRDSCHCLSSKTPVSRRSDGHDDGAEGSAARRVADSDSSGYSKDQSQHAVTLSTFQPKTELPIRHSLLDASGNKQPKLETLINGDGEES